MASLFAVGLPFTYDGTTNHFATTSGGTATVAAVTSADSVTVDSLSGNATLTIGATWSCTALTINNSSATVACDGTHGLTVSGTITHSAGTLDTNGQTCSWGVYSSGGGSPRTLSLGASSITMTANGTAWNCGGGVSNLTLNAGTSTITLTGNNATMSAGEKTASITLTYATVVFSGSGTAVVSLPNNIAPTFTNLTRTGTAVKGDGFSISGGVGSINVTGTLTLSGNSAINRLLTTSNVVGTQRTIALSTTGSVTPTNVDFQDINFTGTHTPVTGTSLGDCGGNSGITFDTSVAQSWSGTSGGNWSANAWTTRVPLPQDDVTISNAFVANQTITFDMPRAGRSIDFTGVSGSLKLVLSGSTTIYGSWTLATGLTAPNLGGTSFTLAGRGSYTLTNYTYSASISYAITAPGGTYTMQDNMTNAGSITLNQGTLDVQNKTLTLSTNTVLISEGSGTLNMQNSTWNCTATGAGSFWRANSASASLNASGSLITHASTGSNGLIFQGGGKTYNNITFTGGGTGTVTIQQANTFTNLPQVTGGTLPIIWPGSTTTTFTNGGNFGNSTNVITMTASSGSATLSFGAQVNADYLNLTNIIAAGTTPAYAGANSTDGGGNTNWVFTAAPSGVNSGFFPFM